MENTIITPKNNLGLTFIALAIVISSTIGAIVYVQSKAQTLTVTGSAKMSVNADNAKWTFTLVRKTKFANQEGAYALAADDVVKVKGYLVQNGIPAEGIIVEAPTFNIDYDQQQYAGAEPNYKVGTRMTVSSTDVTKISDLSSSLSKIAALGVYLSDMNTSYFYSKLPDVRVSLSGQAIEDAKTRAQAIATASGQKIGKLKVVSSGVVQVTAPNSVDASNYGMYDTSTIAKDITFSVSAGFTIK